MRSDPCTPAKRRAPPGGSRRPRSSRRPPTASRLGVAHADQLDTMSGEHERAYRSVHGLGKVTWIYFGMNLGRPGVKADTWITRIVEQALGRRASTDESGELVLAAAGRLGLDPTQLDYAI
jgi:hypothetical protein